jgi:excisionase family DNA binding protein
MSKKSALSANLPSLTEATQAELDRLNRFVTTKWVVDYLEISEDTVKREVARGHLPAYRVGSRNIRFKLRDVEALAQRFA